VNKVAMTQIIYVIWEQIFMICQATMMIVDQTSAMEPFWKKFGTGIETLHTDSEDSKEAIVR